MEANEYITEKLQMFQMAMASRRVQIRPKKKMIKERKWNWTDFILRAKITQEWPWIGTHRWREEPKNDIPEMKSSPWDRENKSAS